MFVDSRQICATVEMVKFVEIDSSCDYLLFSYCTFCDFWSLNRAHLTLKWHHRLHVSNLWMYVTLPAEHNRYSDSLPKIAGGNLQLLLHYYKHLWAARCGRSDWIGGTRWTALVMYWRTVLKGEFKRRRLGYVMSGGTLGCLLVTTAAWVVFFILSQSVVA